MKNTCRLFLCIAIILLLFALPSQCSNSSHPTNSSNSENEYLEKHLPLLKNFVTYLEPNDTNDPAAFQKPWSLDERSFVSACMEQIGAEAPNLVEAIATPSIKIARATKIESQDFQSSFKTIHASTDRLTGTIWIADTFFVKPEETKIKESKKDLVHEIIHLADCGSQFSFSKEWVVFAEPKIGLVQKVVSQNPERMHFELDKEVKKNKIWPGIHASSSLSEALAGCFAAAFCGETFCGSDEFRKIFYAHLLNPSHQRRSWISHFRMGAHYFIDSEYDLAIMEFCKCKAIDRSAPMPEVYIARCYLAEHKFELALQHLLVARRLLDTAEIPLSEPTTQKTYKLLVELLTKANRTTEAQEVLSRFLEYKPVKSE